MLERTHVTTCAIAICLLSPNSASCHHSAMVWAAATIHMYTELLATSLLGPRLGSNNPKRAMNISARIKLVLTQRWTWDTVSSSQRMMTMPSYLTTQFELWGWWCLEQCWQSIRTTQHFNTGSIDASLSNGITSWHRVSIIFWQLEDKNWWKNKIFLSLHPHALTSPHIFLFSGTSTTLFVWFLPFYNMHPHPILICNFPFHCWEFCHQRVCIVSLFFPLFVFLRWLRSGDQPFRTESFLL